MKKYLVGYKQANDEYVYVSGITYNNISVNAFIETAIEFENQEDAKNIAKFLNSVNEEQTYLAIEINIETKEVK